MKKGTSALLITFIIAFSSSGWCESKVFQIGFTIPATATINTAQNQTSSNQAAQTQQMVRGSKTMLVTSIVTL